MNFGPQTA